MWRRCVRPAALFVTVIAGVSASLAPAASAGSGCNPRGSRTVAATSAARAYISRGTYYACLRRVGQPYVLVHDNEVEYGLTITRVRLAGSYVGFSYELDEANDRSVAHVRVIDLRNG